MTTGFIFCLMLVSAMFWTGIVSVFVAARYPRRRTTFLQAAIFLWGFALAALLAWGPQ